VDVDVELAAVGLLLVLVFVLRREERVIRGDRLIGRLVRDLEASMLDQIECTILSFCNGRLVILLNGDLLAAVCRPLLCG
jgi:hypothetical protein